MAIYIRIAYIVRRWSPCDRENERMRNQPFTHECPFHCRAPAMRCSNALCTELTEGTFHVAVVFTNGRC